MSTGITRRDRDALIVQLTAQAVVAPDQCNGDLSLLLDGDVEWIVAAAEKRATKKRPTTFNDVGSWIDDLKSEVMSEINSLRSDLEASIEGLERRIDDPY